MHVLAAERNVADQRRPGFVDRQRYRPANWQDVRHWRTYTEGGEPWFGFSSVRDHDGLPPEILMVPLRGHTIGHSGIAVSTPDGWLLHAGDAYLHHSQLQAPERMPSGLKLYERVMATDPTAARDDLDRLRTLSKSGEVTIICSHDYLPSDERPASLHCHSVLLG